MNHNQKNNSCELCRRRKVRCDKTDPCTTCRRAGLQCIYVPRPRLSRGRNGGRPKGTPDWRARLGRLESLVEELKTVTTQSNGHPAAPNVSPPNDVAKVPEVSATTVSSPETSSTSKSDGLDRYMGSSFWTMLSGEVDGLREVLEESSDDEVEAVLERNNSLSTAESREGQIRHFNFALFGPGSFMLGPDVLRHPPPTMVHKLCQVYLDNVDRVSKVLHRPSLQNYMQEGQQYLHYHPRDPALEALSFAVYYAAVNTMRDDDCKTNFGTEKNTLIDRFRLAAEVSLSNADFLNSADMTVLQAFVIYIVSLPQYGRRKFGSRIRLTRLCDEQLPIRTTDAGRRAWSLMALVVRLARALGLDVPEGPPRTSPFHAEMRHRLWSMIYIQDSRAALDRGTKPLIANGESLEKHRPLNINDVDISINSICLPPEREGLTESTFTIMTTETCTLLKQLSRRFFCDSKFQPSDSEPNWDERMQMVEDYKKDFYGRTMPYYDPSNHYHWWIIHIGEIILAMLAMMAVRPLWQSGPGDPAPTNGPEVLRLAVQVLEQEEGLRAAPCWDNFGWYFWVHWYALAVALAELCSQTETLKTEDEERAWNVVNTAFEQYSETIADSEKGRLWQPVKKLMKKAQSVRLQKKNATLGDGSADFDFNSMPPVASRTQDTSMTSPWYDGGILQPGSLVNAFGEPMQPLPQGPPPAYGLYHNKPATYNVAVNDSGLEPASLAWANWENFINDFTDLESFDAFPTAM